MTYDELERVATKTYPNTIAGKNENVTYTYDTCDFGLGNLCTRVDESGTHSYTYDAYGNQTNQTFTEIEGTNYKIIGVRLNLPQFDAHSLKGTIAYTYDLANNVETITVARGIVATMTYDEAEMNHRFNNE